MIVLPTMHKRIRRSFLRLVLLFGALGVLMVTGITIAGRVNRQYFNERLYGARKEVNENAGI